MNTSMTYHRITRPITHLMMILVLMAVLLTQVTLQPRLEGVSLPAATSLQTTEALYFKSGSHLLRFDPAGAAITGINHNLHLAFLGGSGVKPSSQQSGSSGALAPLEQVTYAGIWQGIDAVFGVESGALAKSEYRVAGGANPSAIRLRYNVPAVLQSDGSLLFDFPDAQGQIIESAPVAWQEIGGSQVPVQAAFTLAADGEVGFVLGAYDPLHTLIIDPAYRWHTFYGGKVTVDLVGMCNTTGVNYAVGVANGYLGLITSSLNTTHKGGKDIVVFKVDGANKFSRVDYFGSDADDEAKSVACGSNTLYIVGTSAKTWNGPTDNAPLHASSGMNDITVLKVTANTADNYNLVYNWHTFYGSGFPDVGRDIALNGIDLYITGASYDTWLGTGATPNPKHAHSGGGTADDIAVLKLNTSGTYQWHTFYGGEQSAEVGDGIDSVGSDVWVVGGSDGTWKGPLTTDTPKHAHSGGNDITALKLNTSGDYVWHTFWGSSSNDTATAVALHATDGTGYILGTSSASWLGGSTSPKHAHSGSSDITVLSLTSAGEYGWHTFYGSSGVDEGRDIVRDLNTPVNLLIVGYSAAAWTAPASPGVPFTGRGDGVFIRLDVSGTYEKHDFYGGSELDGFLGINLNGNMPLLVGYSEGTWNGPAGQEPDTVHNNSHEGMRVYLYSDSRAIPPIVTEYSSHGFIGATGDDILSVVAIDPGGSIIVAGKAAMSWLGPGNVQPLKKYTGGAQDMVILKLTSTGSYVWHTFYGGVRSEDPAAVVTDSSSNIYVAGTSLETWSGPTGQAPLRAYSDTYDIYILKLSSAGTYQWHTFMGGSSADSVSDMAYLAPGYLILSGTSSSTWTGLTAKQGPFGEDDIVVASIAASDGAYQWHTYYGKPLVDDGGSAVAVSADAIYVGGYSPESWDGPSGQPPLHATDGGTEFNAVIIRLATTGNYVWHTFWGNRSAVRKIVLDPSENLYILAGNKSTWNGPAGQLPTLSSSDYAPFVLKLSEVGTYGWHGFFGGTNACSAKSIAYSPNANKLTVLCEALVNWVETGVKPPISPYKGKRDGMLIRITAQGKYQFHTYFGTPEDDSAQGLAIQSGTEQIIAGGSSKQSWSVGSTSPLRAYQGGMDMVIIAFNPMDRALFLPFAFK